MSVSDFESDITGNNLNLGAMPSYGRVSRWGSNNIGLKLKTIIIDQFDTAQINHTPIILTEGIKLPRSVNQKERTCYASK